MTDRERPRVVQRGPVLLFPTCDRDGLLLEAQTEDGDAPATRADAMLFGWMLGLDAAVDAVGAARAVLAVAARQPHAPRSAYRQALIEGLERFVADRGRVASLSARSSDSTTRRRRRRGDDEGPSARRIPLPAPRRDDVGGPGRGPSTR